MNEPVITRDDELTGQVFQQVREQRGWSCERVAGELKLSVRVVQQLEQLENLQAADVYQRGYLRRYAQMLDLPWPTRQAEEAPQVVPVVTDLLPKQNPGNRALFWGIPALSFMALLAWQFSGEYPAVEVQPTAQRIDRLANASASQTVREAPVEERIAASSMEGGGRSAVDTTTEAQDSRSMASRFSPIREARATVEKPATPITEEQSAPEYYLLQFKGDSWVEVQDAADHRQAYRLFHAGESLALEGQPPFRLLIGNHRETVFRIDGRVVDLSAYARGNVVRINTRSLVGNQPVMPDEATEDRSSLSGGSGSAP